MPRVSVIIPSYNHRRYLRQCIDSVLEQTYRDFEIIVVDDGSTDGSVEILEGYGNRIKLICQQNRGTQGARNAAIAASSGELIALLDSDDAWLPHKLERQVEAMAARPDGGLVYSFAYFTDETGRITHGGAALGQPIADEHKAFSQLVVSNFIPTLTVLMRRSCLGEVGVFDETLLGAGDWDMWLRIAARWPVICVPEPLALYRVHQTNTTNVIFKNRDMYREHQRVLDKAAQLAPYEPLDKGLWRKSQARNRLYGADIGISVRDLAGASEAFAQALALDPNLGLPREATVDRLVGWAHRYYEDRPEAQSYRAFLDRMVGNLDVSEVERRRLRRDALAQAAMEKVFACHAAGDLAGVRALLPTGVTAQPKWLLNRGVWAIAADAYLGARLTNRLREALK